MGKCTCGGDDRYEVLRPLLMILGFFAGIMSPMVLIVIVSVFDPIPTLSLYSLGVWSFGIILFLITVVLLIKILTRFAEKEVNCTCEVEE